METLPPSRYDMKILRQLYHDMHEIAMPEDAPVDSFIAVYQLKSSQGVIGIEPLHEDKEYLYSSHGDSYYAITDYFVLQETGMNDALRRPIYRDRTGRYVVFEYRKGGCDCPERCEAVEPW